MSNKEEFFKRMSEGDDEFPGAIGIPDEPSFTKEEAYDNLIDPLMREIIEICERYKISHISTFDISSEEEAGKQCTTIQGMTNESAPSMKICALVLHKAIGEGQIPPQ